MTAEDGVATNLNAALLEEYLIASHKVALRLVWSANRVAPLMPLDEQAMRSLTEEDGERLDAFLLRFNTLIAMVQDHLTRSILKTLEEDVRESSRRDQRLLMEKLGALKPNMGFGLLAELRNRIAHHYPDDPGRQAAILSSVFERSSDLIRIYNGLLAFAETRIFEGRLALKPV